MKAISSSVAVIIAMISVSLVGSYFISKIITEKPSEVGKLEIGVGILQVAGVEWQEDCIVSSGTCTKGVRITCSDGSDCYNGDCVASCAERSNSNFQNNCGTPTYMSGCNCRLIARRRRCWGGTATCSVSGTCDYTCISGWYNDDGDNTNGCENAPPRYSNPIGSSPTNPLPGEMVYHWVNWTDVNGASLDTAILEVNGSGINCDQTVNVSSYDLTGTSDVANISWQVGPNCGGKVIAWKQYANDTANRWNVSNLQTYTIPIDLSFNLTLPGTNPIESSGIAPGTATTPLEFNATAKTDYDVVPCVYGYGCNSGYAQDDVTPIFNFTNTGNVAEKWNISLSEPLPSYITLYGDTDNDRAGATQITTSGWIASDNIPVGGYVQVWLWADFVDALPGTVNVVINHTSTSAS